MKSKYSNEKIEELIAARKKIDAEIEREIEKEKANYKFSWKRAALMLSMILWIPFALEMNEKIFPATSIFSWSYYLKLAK